ncbi:hypothetical protein M2275_006179 [Rhodococcus opacus]|nr:hypothetical protein [Rhodococcus opacus]
MTTPTTGADGSHARTRSRQGRRALGRLNAVDTRQGSVGDVEWGPAPTAESAGPRAAAERSCKSTSRIFDVSANRPRGTSRSHASRQPTHLPALREIGLHANRRTHRDHRSGHHRRRNRVSGLRFAEGRSHALLSALLAFRVHPNGFTNNDLRTLTGELRGLDPHKVSAGQMTYDLRDCKPAASSPESRAPHRYQVADHGLDTAKFLTCVHDRVLRTDRPDLSPRQPLPAACDQLPPPTAPPSIASLPLSSSRSASSFAVRGTR